MKKVNRRIMTVISWAVGVVPPSVLLCLTQSVHQALLLSLIIAVCGAISVGILYFSDRAVLKRLHDTIPDNITAIHRVQKQLEQMTIKQVDVMGGILKKTTEGSEEAKAVVEYFIGIAQDSKGTFGESYISQMIQRNEIVLKKTSALFQTIEKINSKLMEQVQQTAATIEGIYQFVSEINHMAIHTRFLALNALIEAARAGKQAEGFTVVAEEVKKMADHSDVIASQISQIAEDSINLMTTLKQEMQARISESLTGMQSVEKDLMKTFGILKTGIDNISEAIEVVTLNYQAIAKDIKGVIVVLQYQDIISQQLEKVVSGLLNVVPQMPSPALSDPTREHAASAPIKSETLDNDKPSVDNDEQLVKDNVTFFE